jgi:competence protein ComEA
MTEIEGRIMLRAAVALLLAGLIRLGVSPGPGVPPPGGLEAASALRDSSAVLAVSEERASRPLSPGERIDPNRADAVELDRLPGIGPGLARRIVQDRERNGPFRGPEELSRVPGIGAATLADFAEHLTVAGSDSPGPGDGSMDRSVPPGEVRGAAGRQGTGPLIDVNRAPADELVALPGIGPALAERIVDHRTRHGPFRTPDHLVDVPGIGPAILERIRARVRAGT